MRVHVNGSVNESRKTENECPQRMEVHQCNEGFVSKHFPKQNTINLGRNGLLDFLHSSTDIRRAMATPEVRNRKTIT